MIRVVRTTFLLVACVLGLAAASPAQAAKDDRAFIGAEAAFQEGNFRKALSKLEDFLQDHPESRYRQQALYYAAESASEIGKYSIARMHYDALLREYPESAYALRAQFGRAIAMSEEGRAPDAVEALLEVAPQLEDPRDRRKCYRAVLRVEMDRRRYVGALHALGLLLDDGADWREEDDRVLETISTNAVQTDLLEWEEAGRGTTGAGLALFVVLQQRGLTEEPETGDPDVFLFADVYPDHPFIGRIESISTGNLTFPAKPDKIGVILPLSGDYRRPGSDVLDGINLALLDVSAGDLKPTLVVRDSEGDPEKAVAALEELVTEENVVAVLGPLLSPSAVPVAEKAQELRVPMIALSQKEEVPQVGRYVFRNFLTADAQVDAVVDYAVNRYGLTRFAVFYPATERGGAMAEAFWAGVEGAGCAVTAIEPYEADATDFRKPLRKLYGRRYVEKGVGAVDLELPYLPERTKPQLPDGRATMLVSGDDFQAIFVPDGTKRVSMIAPAMVYEDINLADTFQSKPPVVLLGGAGLNNAEYVRRGGRYVQGSLFVDAFFPQSTDPDVAGFVQRFHDTHQREPGLLEALAYDSTAAILTLLGDGHTNRPALRRALSRFEPTSSVTGELGFDEDGEMTRELLLLSVEEDAIIQLLPTPLPDGILAPTDVQPPAEDAQ